MFLEKDLLERYKTKLELRTLKNKINVINSIQNIIYYIYVIEQKGFEWEI